MQVVVWAICSMLSIWLVRPHLLKSLHKGGEDRRSNADALAGQIGEVTEMIPAGGYGRVKLDGDDWKAEAPHLAEPLAVGDKVLHLRSRIYHPQGRKSLGRKSLKSTLFT